MGHVLLTSVSLPTTQPLCLVPVGVPHTEWACDLRLLDSFGARSSVPMRREAQGRSWGPGKVQSSHGDREGTPKT